ncbi:hypothetical protein TRIATDRAFT_92306 [Trichoderma atroviride IMI 206040]|uniref:Uncharacterized protein n=1 Tax=Hypocrea atroviridis (strain ATCC 20476 / IMI 206040) TaxID=452589 RepID=G9NJZ5_HYPAI|nr:uncharacterized protein TRIATDRAFT_92306 [Trichoderma atroviride IMI 206040]EHK49215.1 hypothetical protein TRIATDRAFT_92306 [Trichoderma atroviride IMI 206040]
MEKTFSPNYQLGAGTAPGSERRLYVRRKARDPFTIHGIKDDPCPPSPIGNADWVHCLSVFSSAVLVLCTASWTHVGWGEAKRDSKVDDGDDAAGPPLKMHVSRSHHRTHLCSEWKSPVQRQIKARPGNVSDKDAGMMRC